MVIHYFTLRSLEQASPEIAFFQQLRRFDSKINADQRLFPGEMRVLVKKVEAK